MTNSATKPSSIQDSDIAIIGMSVRFPGANTIEQFWQNLRDGVESISRFDDRELRDRGIPSEMLNNPNYVNAGTVIEDVDRFDAAFFGFNPKQASVLDPQQRLFLECAWEVLEQAGYVAARENSLIGIYAGSGMSQYLLKNLYRNPILSQSLSNYQLMLATEKDFLPTQVAYKLDLTGPAVNVQTACSTSLVAVHLASQAILNGECDLALAGGVSLGLPQKTGYLYQEGMILSPDGHCRAFDARAKGTIRGSGAGIVLLKLASEAIADGDRIFGLIKGSAINNDGALKVGFTAPSVDGQAKAIAEAQAIADINADTITYIEAHGTATELGDPIEIEALTQAFQQTTLKTGFCAVGSAKTNIGHLDTAAGVAGLIKTVLALQHRQIPPSLNFETPNPKIDFANSPFYVNTKLSEWTTNELPRRAGVSAFGIGGTNAHVILEEPPVIEKTPEKHTQLKSSAQLQLLTISAKTDAALTEISNNLSKHLSQNPHLDLADVSYTLSVGRREFSYRRILVCSEVSEAVTALSSPTTAPSLTGCAKSTEPPVIFMFSGQGTQYVNMTRDIYESETGFRQHVDKCAEGLRPELGFDLRHILYPDGDNIDRAAQQLKQTAIAQPALFTIEYALAKLWQSWGIDPQGLVGHSIGEYVAACLAGVFSLTDALSLVAARGRMMQQVSGGAMLAIPLPEAEIYPLLGKELSLAVCNGPFLNVVSGATAAIETLQHRLTQQGLSCRLLHTSAAFHSPMMEPILEPFAQRVRQIDLHPPKIPYLSNVTGTWITEAQATAPDYWVKHLRGTVQFGLAITELLQDPDQILLEVGPGKTLQTLIERHPERKIEQLVLSSTRHPKQTVSDMKFLLTTLGKLWLAGTKVDWSRFYASQQRYRLPLPTYPFQRQRYWIEPLTQVNSISKKLESSDIISASSKKPDITNWFYLPDWKRSPLLAHQRGKTAIRGNILVFVDELGLGEQLVQRLALEERGIVAIKSGKSFIKQSNYLYTINPEDNSDYDTLLEELRISNLLPKHIVHLWNVTQNDEVEPNWHGLDPTQNLGFYSLLYLAQALGKQNLTDECQIDVFSNSMQQVDGEEQLCPLKATLLGAVKVITREYPNITCRSIDLVVPQSSQRREILVEQLLQELGAKSTTDEAIAYRGNYRLVQTYEPVRLEPSDNEGWRLRKEGIYLITGGLGGIGLVLAEYLANAVRAKLVLIGRSTFPRKSEWEQWLNTHHPQDKIGQKIQKIKMLEAQGSEVLILKADLGNPEEVETAISRVTERFGQINGVIHTAGIAGGGVIQLKTREMSESTFNAKVKGTLILADIFKDVKLDWLVLCSSLASVVGYLGQVDYCAANAFLDSFAPYYTNRYGIETFSINWDAWRDVGMAVAAVKQTIADTKSSSSQPHLEQQLLECGLLPVEGIAVFRRILCNSIPQVLVSTIDLDTEIQRAKAKTRFQHQDLEKSLPSQRSSPRPALSHNYVAPRSELEQTIASIWQDFLGIESIGIDDDFFELGGDSLSAILLTSKLSDTLQQKISPNILLNASTIATLAKFLESKKCFILSRTRRKTSLRLKFIGRTQSSKQSRNTSIFNSSC